MITNGGYSLISECLYLHKPLCCFPTRPPDWTQGGGAPHHFHGAFTAAVVQVARFDSEIFSKNKSHVASQAF